MLESQHLIEEMRYWNEDNTHLQDNIERVIRTADMEGNALALALAQCIERSIKGMERTVNGASYVEEDWRHYYSDVAGEDFWCGDVDKLEEIKEMLKKGSIKKQDKEDAIDKLDEVITKLNETMQIAADVL
jgi:hypothetical protein|uniref:Uncharacterized protein n=1 Tax=Siphoviridae sp. ctJ7x27 TaxID=2827835 RepID=A0A8S5S3U0_9CAUD|nr:MAG TPA: hypothetical protein [Siphoviridae sp. ctJ7x27]